MAHTTKVPSPIDIAEVVMVRRGWYCDEIGTFVLVGSASEIPCQPLQITFEHLGDYLQVRIYHILRKALNERQLGIMSLLIVRSNETLLFGSLGVGDECDSLSFSQSLFVEGIPAKILGEHADHALIEGMCLLKMFVPLFEHVIKTSTYPPANMLALVRPPEGNA